MNLTLNILLTCGRIDWQPKNPVAKLALHHGINNVVLYSMSSKRLVRWSSNWY